MERALANAIILILIKVLLSSAAAELRILGVAEGSNLLLAAGLAGTNLAFQFDPSTSLEVQLEKDGEILETRHTSPGTSVEFDNLAIGRYFLMASGGGLSNDLSFTISREVVRPANDAFGSAQPLTGTVSRTRASNLPATSEIGEPAHAGAKAAASLWWRWTASMSGPITVTTRGSDFDTTLAIYSGTNVANLTLLAENDDVAGVLTSQAGFQATKGVDYFLVVDTARGSRGQVLLSIIEGEAPSLAVVGVADGQTISLSGTATNISVSIVPAGTIEYELQGPIEDRGTSSSDLTLTNLTSGDYWLSLQRLTTNDLLASTNINFRIVAASPSLALASASWLSADNLALLVEGKPSSKLILEFSTNLTAWISFAQWTNFGGGGWLAQPVAETKRFYRARSPD
jgi:hypothetical protein